MSAYSALRYKGWRHFVNIGRVLRAQSPFKVLFITVFALGFEIGLFFLFLDGFKFLNQLGGAGRLILNHLFALFFMGMGAMLAVSGMVTAYSTVFRSREIPFLLVRPITISHIVLYKFLQSTMFASWSFGLVVVPFVAAYAHFLRLSPLFAVWTLLFAVPFLILCAGIGSLVVLAVVRWSPTGRLLKVLVGLAAGAAILLFWLTWRHAYEPGADIDFTLSRLVPGLRPASNRLSPSWWIAAGILSLSRGEPVRGLLLWGTLVASCLVLALLVEWIGSFTFLESWRRVMGSRRTGRHRAVLFPWAETRLRYVASDLRAIILKDIRIFVRDPSQWGQALVFFGLLGLYFANLRNFRYHTLPDAWRNTITFLNVFSVSAVICSLGSRFIYPQLSLEGHGYWVIGLSPVAAHRVIRAKFILSVIALVPVSTVLMLLSGMMLEATPLVRLLAVVLATCVSVAVCGLSTGLGAVFLDLDSSNPAAIVSSFGGTLNLVLGLGFMLATIVPFGFLFHMRISNLLGAAGVQRGAIAIGVWLLVITVLTTWIPLRLGHRALRDRDF